MSTDFEIPDNPLSRFQSIYSALYAEKEWFGDVASLRFAAITALTCRGDAEQVAREIRNIADEIKARSGWFGKLSSPLRFIVSAILVQNRDTANDFLDEVDRVNDLFREFSLRRGGIYETMAVLILRIQGELAPIPRETIARFKGLYEEMKRHHWWLTGPDDFPACAALCGSEGEPVSIGTKIEDIYQALNQKGFSTGDPLQSAANLLYLADKPADEIAQRYRELSDTFKSLGVSIWQSDYDELAILSFLDHEARSVCQRVLALREEMKCLSPKPDHNVTFNLAAGIAFLELVQRDRTGTLITDAKALMDMQSVINAQQAAAASAASTAAIAASSAGS